jgi:hypothetical protein
MKKLSLLLVVFLSALFLPLAAIAVNNNAFYVNNAYFKGDGKYDVVVHDPNRDTLQIYVNGNKSVKAKVNKKGFATFQKVKLTGQSKLSFTKKVSWFKYARVNYTKYIHVDAARVVLSDNGPKHSYEDFYRWLNSISYTEYTKWYNPATYHDINTYNAILGNCGASGDWSDSKWVACMQYDYREYLKPETFASDANIYDFLNMVATIENVYLGVPNTYSQSDISSAKAIYNKFVVME